MLQLMVRVVMKMLEMSSVICARFPEMMAWFLSCSSDELHKGR